MNLRLGIWRGVGVCAFSGVALAACSDSAGPKAPGLAVVADGGVDDSKAFESGKELRVTVPESGPVYVDLAANSASGDSANWDIAFEGFDIYTNGGVSGQGQGASFGPLDAVTFIGDSAPTVPFLSPDKAAGAFVDWYVYEGAPTHALWSRYHVLGVKDGERLWKVQVVTYYGERDGATLAGLYKIRVAELQGASFGPTQEIANIDATAGGAAAPPTTPSECLDLASGKRAMLTPEAARASLDWHLCFRRQSISVNGDIGGPRGVGAVDLESGKADTVDALKGISEKNALAKFDAALPAAFEGKAFRGDHVSSGFGEAWVDKKASPITPARGAWLVVDASGKQKFLLGIGSFENPTAKSPGTVVLRTKPVKG